MFKRPWALTRDTIVKFNVGRAAGSIFQSVDTEYLHLI